MAERYGEVVQAASLPKCNCGHDFYDGTGINFHFGGSCPKGDALRAVEAVICGASWATSSPLLTHGIYGGGFDNPWHWSWDECGGYCTDGLYTDPRAVENDRAGADRV